MHNPRQLSARTDLELIAAATQLFDKIYVQSDLTEKMNNLTSRFQEEAAGALERLNRQDEERGAGDIHPAVSSSTTSHPRNQYEPGTRSFGAGNILDHQGSNIST
jgi:hypothetical protein